MLQTFTVVATQLYRYGRDLLFFLLVVCVLCTVFGFSFVNGTWDLTDWVQQVLLFGTVRFFSSFIFRHTRKRTRGVGFGLGWVVGSSHFFYFFWNACMVVYGFAWFDRVGFLWERKVSSQREREREGEIRKIFFVDTLEVLGQVR